MYNNEIPPRAELPSTTQLLRSTLVAFVVAVVLLITAILPAEYGIDPTGVGRLTGLTEMGEIKSQLEKEAEADRKKSGGPQSDSGLIGRVLAGLFISPAAAHDGGHGTRPGTVPAQSTKPTFRTDEVSVKLEPGQGAEIKLVMKKGAEVAYSWTANGGKVNFDRHADGPGGASKSYERGRSVPGKEGILVAAFDGNHGWFWRNRTKNTVTVTLRTNGEYTDLKRVM